MKVAVTVAPGVIELEDRPDPRVAADEVVVEVDRVGICGSDFHLFKGDSPYARFPLVQGHEFAGVVVELGHSVSTGFAVGDRVAVEPLLPCIGAKCYPCRHGRRNCCTELAVMGAHVPGGLAERIAVPATAAYQIGSMDFELGALVEPISIGLQGVTRAAIEAEDNVLVLGGGPIGQAVVLAAIDRGARVAVSDLYPGRRSLALELGADCVFDGGDANINELVADWTNGDGPGVVIEATGNPQVIRQAVDLAAHSGRVCVLGVSTREVSLPVVEFTRKELTIVGSRNNANLFGEAVDLVARRHETVRRLVTHRFAFTDTAAAFEFAINNPTTAEKVHVEFPG